MRVMVREGKCNIQGFVYYENLRLSENLVNELFFFFEVFKLTWIIWSQIGQTIRSWQSSGTEYQEHLMTYFKVLNKSHRINIYFFYISIIDLADMISSFAYTSNFLIVFSCDFILCYTAPICSCVLYSFNIPVTAFC